MTYDLLLLSSRSPGTTFTYEQRAGYTVNGILTPLFPHTKHVYKMNSKNTTKQRVYRAQDPITHSLFKVNETNILVILYEQILTCTLKVINRKIQFTSFPSS